MEKRINTLLIVTALMAAVFAVCAYHFRNDEHDSVLSEDREILLCEYIDIDLLRLDVTVIPYEGENIRVVYNNELPLDISLGDNKLSIEESDKFVISLFTGSRTDFGLYLYLPKEYYREVTICTGSGSVRVGGIDSELLTVITNSGDIISENSRSLSLLTTGSGNITLDCDVPVEKTMIQSRTGNAQIIFPAETAASVNFETISGELHTDLISGEVFGGGEYSFYGGNRPIYAALETGTLTISEKRQ